MRERSVGKPPEDDLSLRILRLVARLGRKLRTEAARSGVSSAEAMVLSDLRRQPGLGVSELAELHGIARSVMSERLKRMEAADLVARDGIERPDRRRVGLLVTAAGRAALSRTIRDGSDRMAARLAELTEKQRRAIAVAVDALDQLTESPSDGEFDTEQQSMGKRLERREVGSA
jgi:DNA-binding MarR family transcriptional regulator